MVQQITNYLKDIIRPEVIIFLVSMLPVLELRGGLIAAACLGVPWHIAMPICIIGNMLPIPFEIMFIKKIFALLKRIKPIGKLVNKLEERAAKKSKKIETYSAIGLFLLVAIPLPGTGAWTGGLVADMLDMRIRRSFIIITLGVITAGLITSLLAYLIPGLIL